MASIMNEFEHETEPPHSANENTVNANKKTIAPADVFKALDEIEMGFLREPLEAEFASELAQHILLCLII